MSNHYTGQLTLERVPEESWKRWDEDTWLIQGKGYKAFYVVDGQQRLTTAIILIKCLLERVPDDGNIAFTEKLDHIKKYLFQTSAVSRAYVFGYEKDNPSYEYLKTRILGEPSNQFQGTETTYTANLRSARDFFRKKLKDVPHEQIERWFKALTQRFRFNVYELEQELDVFVVFETMNNRGKPLSRLELLKNRLIYLSTLLPNSTVKNRIGMHFVATSTTPGKPCLSSLDARRISLWMMMTFYGHTGLCTSRTHARKQDSSRNFCSSRTLLQSE